ncbi:MAG: adenosylcobinamide-GDP ribazoletransferase [Gammaproteobacteria bacterium]|nr:adenosylcobinamide-GDP ribazoletransferase [Gammaproteobacteria bacterium]MBU1647682.1 adenosylcobinamide-GDP ribazoletransferase [Gammaproteobacteria bacterium]MBU1971828.1 adenosylcobinamide-GDP ribazoletransferase [Gammaproteobacteria bacterium]
MIRTELAYFFAALRFFTRLPVPGWVGHSAQQLNHAARYFPLIGVIVGTIGAGVTLAAALLWPMSLAILAGMAATLLATGAFHEDGLADSIDGFGGGWTREQVLAIMKDSRIGSYGAIGIALVLLAKYQALAVLPAPSFFAALVAGHAVSRFASTTLIFALDYARDDPRLPTPRPPPPGGGDGSSPPSGSGPVADPASGQPGGGVWSKSKPLATRMGHGELALAALFGLVPCLLLPAAQVAVALLFVGSVTPLAARYFAKRLGGYTGDCLGATQQLTELAFYLGLACACF